MKEIKRDMYLQKLIDKKGNGMIKIITGIRRCGKSYLLDPLFKNHLIEEGIIEDHIIKLELDRKENKKYLDPDILDKYIHSCIKDKKKYYILLDEIQLVSDFESVLNGFMYEKNLDVYVTGSNSKFLSTDIITEFRGRGDEVKVYPLSFSEFYSAFKGDKYEAFEEYINYGGLPNILAFKTPLEKKNYLINLFETTYKKDIIERNNLQRSDVLDSTINILASSIGSLTNPLNITNTFISNGLKDVSRNTISSYLDALVESFLISKVERYDIKGKTYITTPSKYYFTDIGLRNARLNFRNQEENHILENIIYNELLIRGYNVDVGVVETFEKNKNNKTIRKKLEIDFVCNQISKKYYIQFCLGLDTRDKTIQEEKPLLNTQDEFKKIIIVKDGLSNWHTEEGVLVLNIKDFLLNSNSLDY